MSLNYLRFRSVITGAIVTLDYKITLHDVTDESAGYTERLNAVHKRAAERILWCCLKNGGLYIKFGQGLVIMNHILPRPYLETLVVLQDKVLTRGPHEVSPANLYTALGIRVYNFILCYCL